MKPTPHHDGIWVGDRYWAEIEDYLDWCWNHETEPETQVELCCIRPFEMDAEWVVDSAYEVNEVDQDDDPSAPNDAAMAELQSMLDGWSKRHLSHWAFPTGEMLDIGPMIEQRIREMRDP